MNVHATVQDVPSPRPVRPLAAALWDEFTAIHGKSQPPPDSDRPDADLIAFYLAARDEDRSALCLSGGGIRSASFALGVLQALARKRLLTQFHYLSTVSGGGYIGGWLTALIQAEGGRTGRVQDLLAEQADSGEPRAPAPQLQALRRFTNFLTPRPGLASPDTWAGVLLWLRNTLVNWLLFLPALFALAQLPMLYSDGLQTVGVQAGWPLLLVGLLCLGIGVFNGAAQLPSHAAHTDPAWMPPERVARFTQLGVVIPILIWAGLAPLVASPSLREVLQSGTLSVAVVPLGSLVVMELAYLLAALRLGGEDRSLFFRNAWAWTFGAVAASVVLAAGIGLGLLVRPVWLAVFAPLWVTLAHLLQSLVFVALRPDAFRGELDREWLARLNAVKVVPAMLWAVFAATCLLLPYLVLSGAGMQWVTGVAGLLTGPGAAVLGRFSRATPTSADAPQPGGMAGWTDIIVAIAAGIFGAVLFLLLATAGRYLADAFTGVQTFNDAFVAGAHAALPSWRVGVDAAVVAVAAWLALWFGRRINVNRFSLHSVYRNRIVRAFLGSARTTRKPDGFTGLDPDDNIRMSDTFTARDRKVLFPVVNMTLNLTASHNTAWAERKAGSFTMTPLACGAAFLHRREDVQAMKPARGAYATTSRYGGAERETGKGDKASGVTLGTAVTLSGAAVSPSMGYHSSPAVAFLMTLFNVRLGAWLPNPAVADTAELQQAKPPNALATIGRELLGLSDDRGGAVYLTDGGHFDNLGLYEMVRRRCRHILVIDAGEDFDGHFTDLGDTARKIAIDFNIHIRFDPPLEIDPVVSRKPSRRCFAMAQIIYPEGWTGHLMYLKPSVLADPPIDERAFAADHPRFPHESTLNQFFTESRFESYRRLGEAEAWQLFGAARGADHEALTATLAGFFKNVGEQLKAAPATG